MISPVHRLGVGLPVYRGSIRSQILLNLGRNSYTDLVSVKEGFRRARLDSTSCHIPPYRAGAGVGRSRCQFWAGAGVGPEPVSVLGPEPVSVRPEPVSVLFSGDWPEPVSVLFSGDCIRTGPAPAHRDPARPGPALDPCSSVVPDPAARLRPESRPDRSRPGPGGQLAAPTRGSSQDE